MTIKNSRATQKARLTALQWISAMLQKKLPLRVVQLSLLGTMVSTTPILGAASATYFNETFEAKNFSKWAREELCCSHSAKFVSSPVYAGKAALKFRLTKNDVETQDTVRSELALRSVPANSERWYAFTNYLPTSYSTDPVMEIVAQWHDFPDFHLGEDWRSPALYLKTHRGRWILQRRWDSKKLSKDNKPEGTETIDLGPYKKGVWNSWVFHVKWSAFDKGLVEVWKDKKLVARKTGPNTYNDQKGPYFKVGIYKGGWDYDAKSSTTTQREIYYDRILIGDENASYKAVAP